jgi:MFS superfamily sulfate permease-like transporter
VLRPALGRGEVAALFLSALFVLFGLVYRGLLCLSARALCLQKNKYTLDATQELRGLGIANLLGAMFNW